jgi:hypothetical protein
MMVSGHFLTLTYAGHLQKMIAIGWAPFAFGAMAKVVRLGHLPVRQSNLPRAGVVLGVALGMQLLASHPQIFYATAAVCFLHLAGFGIACVPWKALAPGAEGVLLSDLARKLRPAAMALLVASAAVVACIGISAAQLFPSMEMAGISNRANGVDFKEAVETSYPPVELFEYVIPRMLGDSVQGTLTPYVGKWGERIVSDFIGIPVILLALIGLFGSRRRYRWFLFMLVMAGIFLGLGRYTPIYKIFYSLAPGFDDFRSPGTFMFLANFGFIGLAALGLHVLYRVALSLMEKGWDSTLTAPADTTQFFETSAFRRLQRAGQVDEDGIAVDDTDIGTDQLEQEASREVDLDFEPPFTVPASAIKTYSPNPPASETAWFGRPSTMIIFTIITTLAMVVGVVALAEIHGVNLRIATKGEKWHYHLFSNIGSLAFAIAFFAGFLVLLRARPRIGAVLLGLVAIGFPLYHNLYFIQFQPLNPYLLFLKRQPALDELHRTAPQPVRLLEENLLRSNSMLHEIATVSGYHPVVLADYSQMAEALGLGSNAFGNLFAVNYARTSTRRPPAEGTWVLQSSYRPQGEWQYLWRRYNPAPYLMEMANVKLADATPGAATVKTQVIQNLVQAGNRAASNDQSGATEAALSSGTAVLPPFVMDPDEADYFHLKSGKQICEAMLQRWKPNEIRLHTRAFSSDPDGWSLLPMAEVAAPGWQAATSTGRHIPIITVNETQRALVIPQGENNIRMRYMPFSQRLGIFVSLLAGTLLLSAGAGSVSRRLAKLGRRIRKQVKQKQRARAGAAAS